MILRSGDGGRTWIEQESGVKQNLYALFMMKKNGWVVGSDGLILIYKELKLLGRVLIWAFFRD